MTLESRKYYCKYCGWNAVIELSKTGLTALRGLRWLCHCCGISGYINDPDSPKLLPENAQGYLESDFDFVKRIFGG